MTLPDLLDDLAGSAPPPPPGLAERAWAQGRRRRHRARAQAIVAVAASLALLALVVPGLPRELPVPQVARSSDAAGVNGHPERIGRQWWVRELPDRPGPLAALLKTVEEREAYDEPDGWYGVRADGHRWRVSAVSHRDDLWPALSRDGRLLGHLSSPEGPYVVRDLVSGERQEFAGIADAAGRGIRRGLLGGQAPAHFSPDGQWLLLPAALGRPMLLDVPAGTWQELPEGLGQPAGWTADERIVWLHGGGDGTGAGSAPVRARTTDLRGEQVADVVLPGTEGWFVHQWLGVVSGDGERLAVLSDEPGSTSTLHRFFLDGGLPFAEPVPVDAESPCGMAWGTTSLFGPVLPALDPEQRFLAVEARAAAPEPYTVVAPSVGGRCLVWAGDALDGQPSGPVRWLLGKDQSALAWWWREVLLGGVALLGLVVLGAQRLRRAQRA